MIALVFALLVVAFILYLLWVALRAILWVHANDPEGYTFGTLAFLVFLFIWPVGALALLVAAVAIAAILTVPILLARLSHTARAAWRARKARNR